MTNIISKINALFLSLRRKDSFVRNSAITLTGNSLAVIIGFLFTPFIARVYGPEAYGLFGVYLALAQNLSIVSTLQLPRAFSLVQSEAVLNRLMFIAHISLFATVLLTSILVVIGRSWMLSFFSLESLGGVIYLLPLTILFYSLADIYRSWNVRYKYFQQNAINQVVVSISARSFSLGYGILNQLSQVGLIFGDLFARIIEIIVLSYRGVTNTKSAPFSTEQKQASYYQVLSEYKRYPLFVLPAAWISVLATQVPLFFLSRFFGPSEVGFFGLANSLLNVPVAILAGSLAPVFLQNAADLFQRAEDALSRTVRDFSNQLFYIGFFPVLFLTVFGRDIFRLVFGNVWEPSGVLASYMGFYFLLMTINTPLLSMFRIYGQERHLFINNIIQVLLSVISLFLGYFLGDMKTCILLFSVSNVLFYIFNIYSIFKLVKLNFIKTIASWVLVSLVTFALLKLAHYFIFG